ncbi:hypothetical protein F750_6649 [Streptomyces sp. PAMC 26508]|nr:hypothetical protein F750_6649 [Streptomyces sp. PAMC 26508]
MLALEGDGGRGRRGGVSTPAAGESVTVTCISPSGSRAAPDRPGGARHNDARRDSNALDSGRAGPRERQGVRGLFAVLRPSAGGAAWPKRRCLKRLGRTRFSPPSHSPPSHSLPAATRSTRGQVRRSASTLP